MLRYWKTLLLPFLAGALLTLSFAPFEFWPTALISPGLLLYTIASQPVRRATLSGWLFGLGLFGTGASWVYVSIHVHGHASLPLAISLTALFAAAMALFFAAFTGSFAILEKRSERHSVLGQIFSFAALWVLFEWIRTWLFTGFPWLLLGNGLIETSATAYAPLFGVYGVSFFAVLSSAILLNIRYLKAGAHNAISWRLTAVTLTALWVVSFPLDRLEWTHEKGKPLSVALVQPDIAQEDKWRPAMKALHYRKLFALHEEARQADLTIWPETALPTIDDRALPMLRELDIRAQKDGQGLITGILARRQDAESGRESIYNSMLGLGLASGEYHKQKLVPFGEYVPLEDWLRGLIAFFDLPMSALAQGPAEADGLTFRGFRLFPYVCYEIVYPAFVARTAGESGFLITVSNDTWFGRSIGPLQHFEIARMRAIENRKPLLRSTNNGVTAIVDAFGRVDSRLPQFESGVLHGLVQPRAGKTPYNLWLDWPLMGLLGLYCALRVTRWKKSPPQ